MKNIKKLARLECAEKFIKVSTVSLVGDRAQDPLGEEFYFDLNADLKTLGDAVVKSLAKSRDLSMSEETRKQYSKICDTDGVLEADKWLYQKFPEWKLFDNELCAERVKSWINDMISKYKYKNEKKLYENIQCVSIECKDNIINLLSWINGWHGNRTNERETEFTISSTSSLEVIGAAVKYAIGNCRGKGADLIRSLLFPNGQPETFEKYIEELGIG